jgi:hypothetical protein
MRKKYKILLEGKNLVMSVDGQIQKLGFYTTRSIMANNEDEAIKLAVELIKNDPKIIRNILNEKNIPPYIYAKEIQEADSFDEEMEINPGYVFFPEEDEISI